MNTKTNKLVEAWDPEMNILSKTLKVTLTLDERGIHLLRSCMYDPDANVDDLAAQVAELLERSMFLNSRPAAGTTPEGDLDHVR